MEIGSQSLQLQTIHSLKSFLVNVLRNSLMSLHPWDAVQFMLTEDSAIGPASDTNFF